MSMEIENIVSIGKIIDEELDMFIKLFVWTKELVRLDVVEPNKSVTSCVCTC